MTKYHIYLTSDERRVVINSLIFERNNLIERGRYTDGVDETLEKILNAKIKKVRVKEH